MTTNPDPKKGKIDERTQSEEFEENISPPEHEFNIADGGEFLNDDLRMIDQPLGESNVKEDE